MNALSIVALARLGAKPLEPFGKGSNALKAGTPDAGPVGPTKPRKVCGSTVRSAPGRGRAERQALYLGRLETQVVAPRGTASGSGAALRIGGLDELGKS